MLESSSLQPSPRAAIISASLYASPNIAWDLIWSELSTNDEIGRASLLMLVSALDHHGGRILPRLTENQLAQLYLRLMQLFPFDEPPDTEDSTVTPERAIVWFRNGVISTLAARSSQTAVCELRKLADKLPEQGIWLRWRARDCEKAKRMQQWIPPEPNELLRLESNENFHFVKDVQDLQDLVLDSLSRLEKSLVEQDIPRFEVLWRWAGADPNRRDFEPKEENYLSNYIADWLRTDLKNRGLFVGRELQVRIGQRTDIHIATVSCSAESGCLQTLGLVIEVKGCWNVAVRTGLREQLVDRYLRPNGFTHGLYIVGWYVCDKWKAAENKMLSGTLDDARTEAAEWARTFDGVQNPEMVRSIVLDCRYLN